MSQVFGPKLSAVTVSLQNESSAKDTALEKETLAHQTACVQRDSARMELNKKLAEQKERQAQVKQQIEEIDRLTHIVSSIEREMLSLKRQYEVRVVWCGRSLAPLVEAIAGHEHWVTVDESLRCYPALHQRLAGFVVNVLRVHLRMFYRLGCRWPSKSGTTLVFSSSTATTSCAFCTRSPTSTSRRSAPAMWVLRL